MVIMYGCDVCVYSYKCIYVYILYNTIYCTPSATGPLCSRPSLPNYDLEDPKLFYDVGTVVTLHCAKGYKLAGYDMAKCQENGTWFPRLPNCTLVEVTPDPVKDNGTWFPRLPNCTLVEVTPDPVKDNTTLLPSAEAAGWLHGTYVSATLLHWSVNQRYTVVTDMLTTALGGMGLHGVCSPGQTVTTPVMSNVACFSLQNLALVWDS